MVALSSTATGGWFGPAMIVCVFSRMASPNCWNVSTGKFFAPQFGTEVGQPATLLARKSLSAPLPTPRVQISIPAFFALVAACSVFGPIVGFPSVERSMT